jgi:hypothetical protein
MKKTLLMAAAALAAGIITSQAQPVYSQNVVGYVSIPVKTGYNNIANPLDTGANTLTNIIDNSAGMWNYTLVYMWNGTGYNTFTLDNAVAGGVADATDSFAVPSPILGPGTAFFFLNNTGVSNLVTIVGTVHTDGTGSGSIGVTTNGLSSSPSLTFIGSKFPVGGGLSSELQLPATNVSAGIDFTLVQIPLINSAGNITGFSTVTVDSSFPTGFGDATDSVGVPQPIIPVAQGFFYFNNTGSPKKWIQSL